MKNLLKKLIVVLFLLLMLINNSVLVVISNAVDEIQNSAEQIKMSPIYELNLEKYVNYALDDETKGLMLQANLKTGIKYEEGEEYKPLKFTGVILDLPKINNEYPQNVEVVGISTKTTNGNDLAKDFQSVYDSTVGKVKIVALNKADDEGNIYIENDESARDEYTIFIYYSDTCYTDKNIDRNIEINGKVQVNLADENGTEITTEIKQNYEVNKNISGLISTNIETSDIYNGFINSNNLNNTTYTTEYTENLKIDVGYKEISGELKISSNNSFVNNNNVIDTGEVIYKSTKICKQDVLDKLGEDGYLKIFDTNGELLGEINKDTEMLEDGTVEFKYEKEVSEILITLSKPLNLGTLNIENTKQIKETMNNIENNKIKTTYSILAIDNFQEIDGNTGDVIKNEVVEVYNFSNDVLVGINDSETKIDLTIDNSEWTNNMQNDVTFTANLVANHNKYNLFKNPVIEIKLPNEVENVILGDVSLLYGNGLSIKNANVIEKDSCKVIRVELEGNQSEYMLNSMITGSNVLIPASIIVKKDITSVETNMEMTYSNENGTINDYEKEGKNSKENSINIVSITEDKAQMLTSIAMLTSEVIDGDEISAEMITTVGNQTLKNESSVYEEQIIKYTAKITNNSNKKLSNVKFVGIIPEGTTYVTLDFGTGDVDSENGDDLYKYIEDTSKKEYSETFELNAYEEKEIFYEVKVNKLLDENEIDIKSNLKLYNNNIEKINYSINNKVKKADMSVELKSWITYIGDNIYLYRIKINNNKSEELKNIHAELLVPDGLELTETESYIFEIVEENNKIMIDLDKIHANESEYIDLYIKINQFKNNVYEYNINTYAVVEATGTEKYYSNENRLTAYMKGIEVIQTSQKEGKEVQYEEEIEYDFVIRNISNENTFEGDLTVNIKDFLDENVEPISAEYEVITYNEETEEYVKETKTENFESIMEKIDGEEVAELQYYSELPIGQEIKLKLKVEAGFVNERTVISNNISVQYDKTTKISNTIKNVLISPNSSDKSDDSENDENNNDSTKYSIDGNAWIDSNDDGQINENEQKYSNLKVSLYNVDTNSIAKDEKNKEITAVTDENGLYKFKDVEKGNYLVIFEYDDNSYNLANYKKSGVSESNNSDVIEKQLQIGNDLKTVAVTDTLSISSKDINDINIGLVPKQKFDLSLNKSITNITVEYDGTKNEKSYDETKLAKVEIPAKKISKATVTVEYQIEVKNQGDVDAYVDQIVDYKPETLEFDGSLNSNWSNSGNGKLINSSLSGIRIKPGESKIVKLYLTKNMTDSSVGTITNAAEIAKSSNANNLMDIDSVEGNKSESEDDYSEAQLIISIGTGVVKYTLMIIGLLIVLLIIRYLIKKNIISIKGVSLLLVLFSFFAIVFSSDVNITIAKDIEETIIDKVFNADGSTTLNLSYSVSGTDLPGKWDDKVSGGYNFYIHHKNVTLHNNNPEYLWCSDGRTMCSSGNHYYNLAKSDIEVTKIKVSGKDQLVEDISLENGQTEDPISIGKLGSDGYRYVGPFSIEVNNPNIIDEISINVYGSENKNSKLLDDDTYIITKDIDGSYFTDEDSAIIKGEEFYIQIIEGNGMEIDRVVIKLTGSSTSKGTVNYTVKEKWRCTSVTGSHTMGCRPDKMQIMVRTIKDSISIEEEIEQSAKIVLKTTSTGGRLQILKVDDTTLADGRKIRDVLDKDGYENSVMRNNTINAGFALNEKDEYVTLENLVGENNVTKLPGIQFIICRVDAEEIQTSSGTYTYNKFKYIANIDEYVRLESYKEPDKLYIENEQIVGEYYRSWNEYIDYVMKNFQPYVFATDVDGQILVDGLEEGWYRVIEVGKDESFSFFTKDYEIEGYNYVDIHVGDDTINTIDEPVYIPNEKVNVTSISGFIWKDLFQEKVTTKDNIYNLGQEYGVDGITVRLKDTTGNTVTNKNGVLCETKTGEYGIYYEINGGEYIFDGIEKDKLNDYYVEFMYNGLIYQSVDIGAGLDIATNSKAIEGTNGQNRIDLDQKFTNGIVNNGSNSVKVDGRSDISIGYTGDSYTKEIDKNNIQGCDIVARTEVAGWDAYSNLSLANLYGLYGNNVMYVNLGIYEKPQADLALHNDADSVEVKITGEIEGEPYSQTYSSKYHKVTANDLNPNNSVWDEAIQFQSNKDGYKITAFKEDIGFGDYTLKITYKVAIVNQSTYNTTTNSIVDYYSSDYEFVKARTESGEILSYGNEESVDGNYNKRVISTNIQTDPGKGNWIYIEFKVKASALEKLLNNGSIEEYNVAEINSYKVYKDNYMNTVAAVDRDSVPGNAIPGNVTTYEDDTEAAPNLKITLKERELRGTVFVDEPVQQGEGNIREGNGIYYSDEDKVKVKGVKVTLKGPTTKEERTDSNGDYEFKGFLPGTYQIIFTWGDNEHRVQEYKGTIYIDQSRIDNPQWYKKDNTIRYSDAIDDYSQRVEIDKNTASITDRTINDELNKAYNGQTSDIKYTKMNSSTPKMSFGIVYDEENPDGDFIVENVDFGIIERAKQKLEVEKRISLFKITLANGNPLVDAIIDENGKLQNSYNHTTYMKPDTVNGISTKGYVKTEMDNELIEGATLEVGYSITYVNKSELDYMNELYYKYGSKNKEAMKKDDLVTLKPYGVLDYLDNNLSFDVNKNDSKWKLTTKNDIEGYYTDDDKNKNLGADLLNTKTLLYSKDKIKPLRPNKEGAIELNVSKLLSASGDLTFKSNEVDTVQITKPDDKIGEQHTGTYVKEFPKAESEEVNITPSTGENRAYAVFIIVGIVSLAILGVGIYLIKIKILDN